MNKGLSGLDKEIWKTYTLMQNTFKSQKTARVASLIKSRTSYRLKISWIKFSWMLQNHEIHEIFSPQKF